MINEFKNIKIYNQFTPEFDDFFQTFNMTSTIPLLSKELLVSSFPSLFLNDAIRNRIEQGDVEYTSTSGTSNNRLTLFRPSNWWNSEFESGYGHSDLLSSYVMKDHLKACLTTAVCSGNTCFINNPSYEERIIGSTLYLNSALDPNLWTKNDIEKIDTELHEFSADLLEVNPTYLTIFLILRKKYKIERELFQPKYITCSYELLTDFNRQYIAAAFNCPVIRLFGSTELGVLFIENLEGSFNRNHEKTILELIPVEQSEGIYELVITSSKNKYMPLLRYKTNDLISINTKQAIKTKYLEGEPLTINHLHGRLMDSFRTPSDELITPHILDECVSKGESTPRQYQLDISEGHTSFKYIRSDKPTDENSMNALFSIISSWFPKEYNVQFIEVKQIEPESSGKFKTIKVCNNGYQ